MCFVERCHFSGAFRAATLCPQIKGQERREDTRRTSPPLGPVPAVGPAGPLAPGGRPAADLQARLQLGLVLHGEPPQRVDQPRAAALEVGVGEVVVGGAVFRREAAVPAGRVHFAEAVQVELAHEAGEVLGLEGVEAVGAGGHGGQDLPLKQLPVDDDGLAVTVPEDGPGGRVVDQAPQLGREVVGVDVDGERRSTGIHALS